MRTAWGRPARRWSRNSIALHTPPPIGHFKGVDVACCQSGIGGDYGGFGYQELSERDKQLILSAYPRLQMKRALTTRLSGIAQTYPTRKPPRIISLPILASDTCWATRGFHSLTCYHKRLLPNNTLSFSAYLSRHLLRTVMPTPPFATNLVFPVRRVLRTGRVALVLINRPITVVPQTKS